MPVSTTLADIKTLNNSPSFTKICKTTHRPRLNIKVSLFTNVTNLKKQFFVCLFVCFFLNISIPRGVHTTVLAGTCIRTRWNIHGKIRFFKHFLQGMRGTFAPCPVLQPAPVSPTNCYIPSKIKSEIFVSDQNV